MDRLFARITPDRRYALIGLSNIQVWDLPARRPLRWLIGSIEAWSLLFLAALFLVRLNRRFTPPAAAAPPA
jgi:hypothetical protein